MYIVFIPRATISMFGVVVFLLSFLKFTFISIFFFFIVIVYFARLFPDKKNRTERVVWGTQDQVGTTRVWYYIDGGILYIHNEHATSALPPSTSVQELKLLWSCTRIVGCSSASSAFALSFWPGCLSLALKRPCVGESASCVLRLDDFDSHSEIPRYRYECANGK